MIRGSQREEKHQCGGESSRPECGGCDCQSRRDERQIHCVRAGNPAEAKRVSDRIRSLKLEVEEVMLNVVSENASTGRMSVRR